MSSIVKYCCEELDGAEISCIMVKGAPWLKGLEVATVLGYKYASDAVKDHVPLKFQITLRALVGSSGIGKTPIADVSELNTNWISEAGLYKLILRSKAKHAEVFQDWVGAEVLPSIRETGSYAAPLLGNQIELLNETDLRYKVIDCIRNKFVELVVVPGLREMQATKKQRIDGWRKGYIGGQPDILILNKTAKYDGFAIELKTPKGDGRLRDKQRE